MKILGRHTSYNVQKVLWLADELALDYTHEQVGGRFGGTDTPEFLNLNPRGKVPVLVCDEGVVVESNTILRYIASQYAPDTWLPSKPYPRSQIEAWMDWSTEKFEPAFVGVFWGYYRTPIDQRDESAIADAVALVEACLGLLNTTLSESPYLAGDSISLADVATGVFLHRLDAIDLTIHIPTNVTTWYKQLSRRPAYKQWVMSDFGELEGRSGY